MGSRQGSTLQEQAALRLVPCAVSQEASGEVSEDQGTLIHGDHGDSEKILQGLTLELTKCLPLSFRIMVRSF